MTIPDMEHIDQRIDQLLHALGNIESPPRLEARVAERVARHSATAGPRTSRRFFFSAWPVAALAVLILALAALHSHRKPATIAQLPQPSVAKPQLLMQAHAPESNPPASHTAPSQHHILEAAQTTPAASTDPDAIALAETLAPSRPAPPLPLSQQEKLMLRILRSGEQEEIAALIPAERDALFARDQAAFNEYFALTNQPSHQPSHQPSQQLYQTGDQK